MSISCMIFQQHLIYHGQDINRISVTTNGMVELLEDGENCGGGSTMFPGMNFRCSEYGSYGEVLTGDVLMANYDDLYMQSTR
jgi:hypothetical protein